MSPPTSTQGLKRCPYCAEDIREHAIVCRFCGSRLDEDAREALAPVASDSPRWFLVGLTVILAGAIPALWSLSQLEGVKRSTYLLVYFLLQLLPLCLGFGAAARWRGARTVGIVALALCAGAVAVAIGELVVGRVTIHSERLVRGSEDYVAWAGTVLLYAAGMLYGKRRADRKRPMAAGGATRAAESGVQDVLRTGAAVAGVAISLYTTIARR